MRSMVRFPLPGQIFIFGGFVLRANSLAIWSRSIATPLASGQFGNLNYTGDICGDLVFDGFEPSQVPPHNYDEHDLALSSDSVRRSHLTLCIYRPSIRNNLRHLRTGGWTPPRGAANLSGDRASTDITSYETHVAEMLDSSRPGRTMTACGPYPSNPIGHRSWSLLRGSYYFSTTIAFWRRTKLVEVSLPAGDPWPKLCPARMGCRRRRNRAPPPPPHLVATVDDLTRHARFRLRRHRRYGRRAGIEQKPPPTGRWTATSSYDIDMVDNPKEGDGDKTMEDNPSKKQSKAPDVCVALSSLAIAKAAIPAQEDNNAH